MDIKIPEREAHQLSRKILEIRAKIRLLEYEMESMPIRDVSNFMERTRQYQVEMTKLRFKCAEALTLLRQHLTTNELPGM